MSKFEPQEKNRQEKNQGRKIECIKEKTGASAEEVRKAVVLIGFDRAKVEEYLKDRRMERRDLIG